MAVNERHAAWQKHRSYAVTVVPDEGEQIELAAGLTDFLEAVDVANEWLEREDPTREGRTRLAIFDHHDGESTEVWRYPSDRGRHDRPLVDTFGFDPVGWAPAVKEFVAERPLPTPPPRREPPAPRRVRDRTKASEPGPAPPRRELPDLRPYLHALVEVSRFLRAAWGDTGSRICLIVAAVSLWLALTLVDIRFLVLLLVALTGLSWRRGHRAAAAERDASDADLL